MGSSQSVTTPYPSFWRSHGRSGRDGRCLGLRGRLKWEKRDGHAERFGYVEELCRAGVTLNRLFGGHDEEDTGARAHAQSESWSELWR